jgi:hypothetical protein
MSRKGLTAAEAEEIYKTKLDLHRYKMESSGSRKAARGLSVPISKMYQISPKTVRDIWNHVTWKYATYHLWHLDPEIQSGSIAEPGEEHHVVADNTIKVRGVVEIAEIGRFFLCVL